MENIVELKKIEECTVLIENDYYNIENYKVRAGLYLKCKLYDDALKDYKRIISLCANESELYYKRGNIYVMYAESNMNVGGQMWKNQDRYEKAINDYTKAIALNPKEKKYYIARANIEKEIFEDDEDALEDYKIAFNLDTKDAEVCKQIAEMYLLLDDDKNQEKFYKLSIQINPDNFEAYSCLGSLYLINDKFEKAIYYFSEAIKLVIEEKEVYYDRAYCYYREKMYLEALRDLEIYKNKEEEISEKYYFLRGEIFEEKGDYEVALKEYSKAYIMNKDVHICEIRANLFRKIKNIDLATEEINKILDK